MRPKPSCTLVLVTMTFSDQWSGRRSRASAPGRPVQVVCSAGIRRPKTAQKRQALPASCSHEWQPCETPGAMSSLFGGYCQSTRNINGQQRKSRLAVSDQRLLVRYWFTRTPISSKDMVWCTESVHVNDKWTVGNQVLNGTQIRYWTIHIKFGHWQFIIGILFLLSLHIIICIQIILCHWQHILSLPAHCELYIYHWSSRSFEGTTVFNWMFCTACGKTIASSDGFARHRTSWYLHCTTQRTMDIPICTKRQLACQQ